MLLLFELSAYRMSSRSYRLCSGSILGPDRATEFLISIQGGGNSAYSLCSQVDSSSMGRMRSSSTAVVSID